MQLEQYIFCLTITYLQSTAFKVDELNQFSYSTNQDRYRWKEMILWVHERHSQLSLGQPPAKINPGHQVFSKDNVREIFSLLERTVELKLIDIIYLCNVDDSALTTF
jgi:hypothetical protein